MSTENYLGRFQKALKSFDKKLLQKKGIEIITGSFEDCVFLRLSKRAWVNESKDLLTADSKIYFSLWVEDSATAEKRIIYNLHAVKLRKLKGYSIESGKFAEAFRARFKPFQHTWQNVSVKFGPLTLMQGWLSVDAENFQEVVLNIVNNFLKTEHLIDDTLATFKQ